MIKTIDIILDTHLNRILMEQSDILSDLSAENDRIAREAYWEHNNKHCRPIRQSSGILGVFKKKITYQHSKCCGESHIYAYRKQIAFLNQSISKCKDEKDKKTLKLIINRFKQSIKEIEYKNENLQKYIDSLD
jgi:hypothetical protein